MAKKTEQSRMPQYKDPFEESFGPEPAAAAAKAEESADDAFDASFGTLGPDGRLSASEVPSGLAERGQDLGAGTAFTGQLIEDLPIVGPWVKRNLDEGIAQLRSFSSGKPVEEERQAMEAMSAATRKAHPIAAGAGGITGQVAGYGLAAAAAPAAFGLGAASLPAAAVTSGATNALIAGADAYMRGKDPGEAAMVGGGLGLAAPVVGAAVGRLFTNYIEPEVLRLADLAIRRFGIPLGSDLISTNPMLRFASSVMERMPFGGGQAAKTARHVAVTRAVAREMGETADRLTAPVMNRIRTRLRGEFEYAADNTPRIGADPPFGNDLTRIWGEIRNPVDRALTGDERRVVEGHMRRVLEMFRRGNGFISGREYQQMTRRGTALDRATDSSNPNIKYYAVQLRGALDDALLRHAPADAAERLTQARRHWWVMKTIEDLAEKSPDGVLSPALLLGEVRKAAGDVAYGGGGNLAELGRIGQLFLKEAPSSGTAERAFIMKALEVIGSGGTMWALFRHPLATIGGVAAPMVAGKVLGSIARSPRLGNALVNAAQGVPGPVTRAAQGSRYVLPGIVQQARPLLLDYLREERPRRTGGGPQSSLERKLPVAIMGVRG